jgi:hypothetical protein
VGIHEDRRAGAERRVDAATMKRRRAREERERLDGAPSRERAAGAGLLRGRRCGRCGASRMRAPKRHVEAPRRQKRARGDESREHGDAPAAATPAPPSLDGLENAKRHRPSSLALAQEGA